METTEEGQPQSLEAEAADLNNDKKLLSHTNSLPSNEQEQTNKSVFKNQSFRIKRNKEGGGENASSRWSFGGVAKAVGSGVTAFGSGVVQGTRAVGTGVVQGTQAVGSGVVQGTKAVGSGVVKGTKAVGSGAKVVATGVIEGTQAVGSGVVEGTKVVASVSKDMTVAAGSKVVQAGDIALSGVNAVGEATVSAATATADAVKSAVHDSLHEEEIHVVLPGETIDELADKYQVNKRDLIRANSLCRRSLRAGQELVIPTGVSAEIEENHPNEILILKATNEHDQRGMVKFTLDNVIWSESGEEKYFIEMVNVQLLRVDLSNDALPDLLPADSANNNRVEVAAEVLETEEEGPKPNVAQVVEVVERTSPGEDDEFDFTSIRVDFTLFNNEGVKAEEEKEPDDEDSCSSSEDDNKDQKTKSFLFERNDLLPLATYLELWHAEVLEQSPRLNTLVSRQKDLFCTESAFSTFTPNDLMTPVFTGESRSDILQETHLQQIFANLPAKIQNQPWTCAYSTQVNGFSLRNLYRSLNGDQEDREESEGPCLIVIQNTENKVFGSFLTCYPSMTDNFVGTGKSWLFAFGGRRGQKLRIYKWSGLNEHFFRGTIDNMIIGADEGRFGILLDGDLHKGRVQECATFKGWQPADDLEEDFVIGCLEVWTFESA